MKTYELRETARHDPDLGHAPCKVLVRSVSRFTGSFAACSEWVKNQIGPDDMFCHITYEGKLVTSISGEMILRPGAQLYPVVPKTEGNLKVENCTFTGSRTTLERWAVAGQNRKGKANA